jgi:hypothetical protein
VAENRNRCIGGGRVVFAGRVGAMKVEEREDLELLELWEHVEGTYEMHQDGGG